jgi:two-component system KDP operon response regulator KdpE
MGGKETCRRICHAYPCLPIIMLTVRDDEHDKVEALDAGAYDYVTKPFQIHELAARLRAVIRRYNASIQAKAVSAVGDITLDYERRQVQKRGEDIHLAPKQYETLCYLMEHAGHPVPHERLLASVWGPLYGNEREYLRVIINQLRKKIEDDPAHPTYILTETHIGYRFRKG